MSGWRLIIKEEKDLERQVNDEKDFYCADHSS